MQDRGQFGEQQQPTDQPGWTQQPYTQQVGGPTPNGGSKGKKIGKGCGLGCLGVLVIFVIAAIAVGNKSNGTNGAATATAVTTAAVTNAAVSSEQPVTITTQAAPTSAAPTTPDVEQVTFKCTGSTDGDGIDITYGAEGTNDAATSLPFTKTVQLSSTAQYYNVTAQLQGGGNVNCTTTVESGGQTVTQTGSASGGYNIASAEVCSSFDGSWDAC